MAVVGSVCLEKRLKYLAILSRANEVFVFSVGLLASLSISNIHAWNDYKHDILPTCKLISQSLSKLRTVSCNVSSWNCYGITSICLLGWGFTLDLSKL